MMSTCPNGNHVDVKTNANNGMVHVRMNCPIAGATPEQLDAVGGKLEELLGDLNGRDGKDPGTTVAILERTIMYCEGLLEMLEANQD